MSFQWAHTRQHGDLIKSPLLSLRKESGLNVIKVNIFVKQSVHVSGSRLACVLGKSSQLTKLIN
jgi:hypothetical protein